MVLPRVQVVDGNHIVHASASYELVEGLRLTGVVTNIFNQTKNLYPMNSIAQGDLSDGTPATEETSF